MKRSGSRSLCSLFLASVLAGCGGELEQLPEDTGLEQNQAAVISGASSGSTVQVSATDGVNLRSGPGTTYAILVTAPYLATATVVNGTPSNGFYQVNYQGTVGWTHGDYWNVTSGAGLRVNGYTLSATQEQWVRWLATYTVPKLQGTRDARLNVASRVAWWSLKEGVLDLANPFAYSNCNTTSGDVRYGPLQVCTAGRAWQVGISGIQVPNFSMASVQNTSATLHASLTEAQVLGATAIQAGYASGTSTYNSIVNSSGDLRKSWLLRNHAVGVALQDSIVNNECVVNSYAWCYGTGWDTTARYAPSRAGALKSIGDLKAILSGLAP